jgi:nucleoside-diphosphate-sugar epimerase
VFRPHNVYGSDMGWEHVIPDLAVKAARQLMQAESEEALDLEILGDGRQTRAFVHVNDFVDGLMLVINKGVDREIYHIGKDEEISILELANLVVESLGRRARITTASAPKGETNRRCPDISKLRALGFSPSINLRQGLPDVVNWYKDNIHILESGK